MYPPTKRIIAPENQTPSPPPIKMDATMVAIAAKLAIAKKGPMNEKSALEINTNAVSVPKMTSVTIPAVSIDPGK